MKIGSLNGIVDPRLWIFYEIQRRENEFVCGSGPLAEVAKRYPRKEKFVMLQSRMGSLLNKDSWQIAVSNFTHSSQCVKFDGMLKCHLHNTPSGVWEIAISSIKDEEMFSMLTNVHQHICGLSINSRSFSLEFGRISGNCIVNYAAQS